MCPVVENSTTYIFVMLKYLLITARDRERERKENF